VKEGAVEGVFPDGRNEYYWIVEFVMQAGPTTYDAMGNERPMTWHDINEYDRARGNLEFPWMKVLAKELSSEYLSGRMEGKNPLSKSPFAQSEDQRNGR
jgi:hypothetical protein